jgi:antitoxin component of MazEF toxin-antitoxin module
MDPAALLKLMDLAIGAMNTVSRANTLIATARAEGRTVTMEEVDALIDETAQLRDEWDSGN